MKPEHKSALDLIHEGEELYRKAIASDSPDYYLRTSEEAYRKFYSVCMNFQLDMLVGREDGVKLAMQALLTCNKYLPDMAKDILSRWRDSLNLKSMRDSESLLERLSHSVKSDQLDAFDRMNIVIAIYNNSKFNTAYPLLEHIGNDASVDAIYRSEAVLFLLCSGDEHYTAIAQDILIDIIDDVSLDSAWRFSQIAQYFSNAKTSDLGEIYTTIRSMFNTKAMKIPFSYEFTVGLLTTFFFNEENEITHRILAAQGLIQYPPDHVSDQEKEELIGQLMDIARDTENTVGIRADAADVVWRIAQSAENKKAAKDIIYELGHENQTEIEKSGDTIYSDSQNVHRLEKVVYTFIEKIINETEGELIEAHVCVANIKRIINDIIYNDDSDRRLYANNGLYRITVDSARFTNYNITSLELVCHIYMRILKHPEDIQTELFKRLCQELSEMADTCSSGHAARLVNVLSEYDYSLRIDFEDQVIANISGRVNAAIRNADEGLKELIALGSSSVSEPHERDVYIKFIEGNLLRIKRDLEKEFVAEKWITSEEFEAYYTKAYNKWMQC